MTVVIDTNVLLVSISSKSESHSIFQSIMNREIELAVTQDILFEYEEIISRHIGIEAATNLIKALARLPNVNKINTYYFWQLINKDPDDNKFVDCAVAANAQYLVSDDSDFRIFENNSISAC